MYPSSLSDDFFRRVEGKNKELYPHQYLPRLGFGILPARRLYYNRIVILTAPNQFAAAAGTTSIT